MSDIFISYARSDKNRAKQLADVMARRGWSVWWDRNIPPGRTFDEIIEQALDTARCVIVLWSGESVASNWVKAEAADALTRGILVPVLIENVKIPLEFRRIQAADLSDWQGASDHSEFSRVMTSVAARLGEQVVHETSLPGEVDESAGEGANQDLTQRLGDLDQQIGDLESHQSFGPWYKKKLGSLPSVAQAALWLFGGYVFIPLWFAMDKAGAGNLEKEISMLSRLRSLVEEQLKKVR